MESPNASSSVVGSLSGQSSRSRSSTKLVDDVTSLTSFNPFSEEDENDQLSYTLVTSIFSRMKNTLSAPLSSAVGVTSNTQSSSNITNPPIGASESRRPSYTTTPSGSNFSSRTTTSERPNPLIAAPPQTAPPLVSLTPAHSEIPSYIAEYDRSVSQRPPYSPAVDFGDTVPFGSIPGFPIHDDARSIKTSTSIHRSGSVSKVMRRLRGEGLSRDYWMDDENCKECYDCKSVFTTWRRKHHCRICGQIFCSRCASNIIKGARFGSEGMVRVCNLCLEKLAKVEEDDDDDRRSIVSSVTSFPAHQLGIDSFTNMAHPQSPFAASQLFGRTDEPFNLYSIAEINRPDFGSDDDSSRPETPYFAEGEDGIWQSIRDNPAPFRRPSPDEEKDHGPVPSFNLDMSATEPQGRIEFPTTKPITIDTSMSSIQFPIGSPERSDSPRTMSRPRGPNTYGEYEVATPFIRSRVQSRLDTSFDAEPGWRTRRESTAYTQELNLASMHHLKVMLRQMLTIEGIPNIREWEEILLRLALRIAREMTFTALPHRQGQDMDVRRYVKIKKIPGGSPRDSEYVNGAVITKNVAHKQMSRLQANPRVMLVTFPLEFSRVEGQYMHFAQIVRQEKEYLGNLASRIAALRPHVVLVEQSVSRLALEALVQHNIAVARAVKPSAIQTISRMTQGDVFSSMDKLALEPRLGHCGRFCIQSYDHPLIPGQRKTYMRFEGCNRDMGCTIILRGGDLETLRRIKKVTRFLTFIVRNLKLETHLWKDSVISLPSFNAQAIPPSGSRHLQLNRSSTSVMIPSFSFPSHRILLSSVQFPFAEAASVAEGNDDQDLPNEDAERLRLTRRIDVSLEPYTNTFISVSATLRFPPPYPIRRMKELDNMLIDAKRTWEDEVVRIEERLHSMHKQEETVKEGATPASAVGIPETQQGVERDDIVAQIDALPVIDRSTTPKTKDGLPPASTPNDGQPFFALNPGLPNNSSTDNTGSVLIHSRSNLHPTEEPECMKTEADIYYQSRYTLLKWEHEEHRRIWEWYLRKNQDDFVVEKYQCIHLREYTIPAADAGHHRPCFAPCLRRIKFYGENDLTLGQFIEKVVSDTLVQFLDPKAVCTGKGCDQPLARHCKVFVHNETRLFVAVEQWDGQIIGRSLNHPSPDLITTWSACRICGSATPFIPVSEEMQRYSFAKFLELHFYPADVKLVQGAGCQHNIYQHHIRYFASKGMTVRFQADPVVLHEIVYPPFRLRVRPETQLDIKNADFKRLHRRNMRWYSGLVDDLKLISIEASTGDEKSDTRLLADVNTLITRAEAEREEISHLINQLYEDSPPMDTLALNKVHAYRQDKIVAWEIDVDRLPKPRPVQTVAIRNSQRASSAFGSVRAMWPLSPYLPSSRVSEASEVEEKTGRMGGDSLASSTSENSEPESGVDLKKKTENQPADIQSTEVDTLVDGQLHCEDKTKPDPDSDSTIGAVREEISLPEAFVPPMSEQDPVIPAEESIQRASRLPRRTAQNLTVAELVKKYQDFLPAQGVHDLTQTAFAPRPVMSESEQEYPSQLTLRPGIRSKSRHRMPVRKVSTSDFEQGYAANVAPRYLTHSRRTVTETKKSRIPAPKGSSFESHESSRRPSPEKRFFSGRGKDAQLSRPSSPPANKPSQLGREQGKNRAASRSKDKPPTRPLTAGNKSAFRRPTTGTGTKVPNIAKHFERLNRDAERSKSRYAVIRGKRARPVASARAKVQVLDSLKDAIGDDSESSDSPTEADDEDDGNEEERPLGPAAEKQPPESEHISSEATSETVPLADPFPIIDLNPPDTHDARDTAHVSPPGHIHSPPSPFLSAVKTKNDTTLTPPASDQEVGGNGAERISILKALSGFWPQPARHSIEGDDPMSDPEHIFRDSSMVVRIDEPTSIIALALNSPQYRDMLAKSRAEKRTAREAKLTEGGEAFMPDDRSVAESTSTWGVVNVDSADSADPTDDLRVPSSKLPWAITFDKSDGLTISCTILYPEQFDALRRTYDCEKNMVESLSRCIKWNASGGKSGSAFLKTRDDRFIAKELSKAELQTMETFAPAYFDYMSSAIHANRPTLLAKVFGCYKLTFRKEGKDKGRGKSNSTQMNLLVMENLCYDRRFSKIFDLKGSTRNRHVQSTGRENEVLLDENLVESANLNPLYLREHSKRILRGALYNDSKFLADINVMDYSLVCGVDSQNGELVIGIVDYIRTYTWDKKLESWVKESAFLGGAGKGEPTIVTPRQYRQRFISAMERYFPLVPDRWMKQIDTTEEETTNTILSELWPDW